MKSRNLFKLILACVVVLPFSAIGAQEQKLPARADLEQKLDAQLPLDLKFRDDTGALVPLSTYFHKRPVVLQMGYYRCWLMCDVVTGGLLRSLQDIRLTPGRDFDVVFVSIDPKENWKIAAQKKSEYVKMYGQRKTAAGWHFLTGNEPEIQALAQAVGFHYFYDKKADQFAHPSGVMVLTPEGRVAKYFYGIEYNPRDLRLALIESSHGHIGSPVDQLLLLCYHWNPLTGKYGLIISRVLSGACAATVAVLGAFIGFWFWREGRQRRLHLSEEATA